MFLINDLIALLAANLILSQALGTSTIFIAAGSRKNLVATAGVITIFTTVGSAAAYLIDLVLQPSISDLRLLFYTMVIGVLYAALLVAVYKFGSRWFEELRRYIHVSAFNCAVMGTLFTISGKAAQDSALMHFGSYVGAGLQAGAGFVIAALILSAAYGRLCSAEVPASFRGFPAMLIYLGIISMAVYALS